MKKITLLCISLITITAMAQNSKGGKTFDTDADSIAFEKAPVLTWESKTNYKGKPSWNGFLLVKAKLNGVFDIEGGLQEQETFNVGRIDIYGTDDSKRFWMDVHQTQIRLWSQRQTKGGPFIGYLEMDGWGGNKHVRLRHVWFDYKFMHIGQDWTFFGDKDIWPNVMDWDGPPSGVWRREPQVKFYWETEKEWKYEVGFELPGAQISYVQDIDTAYMEAYQFVPDFIGAVRKTFGFGHLRLSAIYRTMAFKYQNDVNTLPGYGASISGYINTNKKRGNAFQFQAAAGQGIAAYLVSFDGLGYDAITTAQGMLQTIPAVGAWVSYEYYFGGGWHSNIVVGFSDFKTPDVEDWKVEGEGSPGYEFTNTTISLDHRYVLFNIMFDPTPGLTLGIEYNLGRKDILYAGDIDDGTGNIIPEYQKGRTAQRISFGAFYDF